MNDGGTAILDPDALIELREKRLRRTVELCFAAHPYYRERLRDLGIGPPDIRTLGDLERLPLVDKSAYMARPEEFCLRPADAPGLSLEESTVWNIAYTTGTTGGKPSPFFNTSHDQFNIMLQARRCGEAEGLRTGDLIANIVPLSPVPAGGFLVVSRTAEAMGLPVVSALTGGRNAEYPVRRGLDEAIDCMAAAAPSVFWGVPSFVRRFFRRARERGVAFPRARMVIVTGEPVSAALAQELAEHLRAFGAQYPQVRLRYSFTEMQGGLIQCRNGADAHNLVPELYLLETVDPATGRRMPEGEEGALAITHLHRRGTVFLRYLVGDVVALRTERCPHCGALGERLVQRPRRTGTLVKVRGMLINPELVTEALSGERGISEFQLAVRKTDPADPDSMDRLIVRIEAEPGARERLAAQVPALVQQAVMVRPEIEFAEPGEIHDPLKNVKAKRFVDER